MEVVQPEGDGTQAVAALKPHPAAEIFPVMVGAEFDSLVADIKQNGQVEPIVTYDNTILDGRHRYRACQQLGIEPRTTKWEGNGSVEAFVISKNLRRRQLDASQRAMAAAAYATLKRGGDNQSANLRIAPTAAEVAALFGVSTRSIETARVVRTKGVPELLDAVLHGAVKVSAAAELVELPKDRQRDLATADKYEISKAVKRRRKAEAIQRERAERLVPNRGNGTGKLDVISPPEVAALPNFDSVDGPITHDRDFQAEADAAARDIEIERDERIALAGAGELAAENEKLKRQVEFLDRRVAALLEENGSLKYREKMWRERAIGAGWKGRADA